MTPNAIRQILADETARRLSGSGCRGSQQCANPCATSTPLCAATGKIRKTVPPPEQSGCAEQMKGRQGVAED